MNVAWCNGEWMDPGRLSPGWRDRGWLHGLGLFETMLAIDGGVAFGGAHWERLAEGCRRLDWELPWPRPGMMLETAAELLERAGLDRGEARLRLAVSGGSGPLDDLAQGADRMVWMTAAPLGKGPDGLAVDVSPWLRNERGPLAGLKCASYAENLVALDDARKRGFDETLFFNCAGHLCEAATANVFLNRGGSLGTPPLTSGCLPGVARRVILALARREAIACAEEDFTREDLESAEGILLTSALRGPVAVVRCGTRALQSTVPGERLATLWRQAARESASGQNPEDLAFPGGVCGLSSAP